MNNPDKVIGYIECLAQNGTVRERIPYENAEMFKKDTRLPFKYLPHFYCYLPHFGVK